MRSVKALPLLLASLGCAGAVHVSQLPEEPLAFVFRTREESDQRAERMAQREGREAPSSGSRVHLNSIPKYLGLGPTREELLAGLAGRMAFFESREERVVEVPFALKGSRPLDWSPDHRRLLFVSRVRTLPQLFEYDRESEEVRALTGGRIGHAEGCYGPGGRLAIVRVEDGASRIYVTRPGGGVPEALTPGPADSSPTWSPTGGRLVYQTRDAAGRDAIAVVDPDGEDPPEIVARGRRPVFTPDGAWVIFSAPTREGWRLRRMREDGSGKSPFGSTKFEEHEPAVSPDGRYVVYMAEEDLRERLRIRRIDGAGDRPLVFDGDGFGPVW